MVVFRLSSGSNLVVSFSLSLFDCPTPTICTSASLVPFSSRPLGARYQLFSFSFSASCFSLAHTMTFHDQTSLSTRTWRQREREGNLKSRRMPPTRGRHVSRPRLVLASILFPHTTMPASYGQDLPDQAQPLLNHLGSLLTYYSDVEKYVSDRAALEREYGTKLQALSRKMGERKVKRGDTLWVGEAVGKGGGVGGRR